MFNKILIANRGEIACRVMRTAKDMGISTVAVYSDVDQHALHVKSADEAVRVGTAASSESYLLIDRIINAALKTGAQAIHPGYGFLSENAEFAKACKEHNLVFIGPPASAIEAMGSKSAAKSIMEDAGVPLVPGYHGADQSSDKLKSSADEMGYPVLLKAVAGGGGKGMRQVWSEEEFSSAFEQAKSEAIASFGNGDMLVEKYLTEPRHVEVQVFCDTHGNGVYLFERDCSVQRRHQKIIEEAPAPGLSESLRQEMGETAVRAAKAIDYVGAGTVEFLLDSDGSFYFMEMNTRLQVEHPVTEMITGQDLVFWQLKVASGQPLPRSQEQLQINGHAFEARVYAEDPNNDFLPTAGHLRRLIPPTESDSVRVDTGVVEGDEVSSFYDPMIAKLVVWAEDRKQALNKLSIALRQYRIQGVTTNLNFLHDVANHSAFRDFDVDTSFIDKHSDQLFGNENQTNPIDAVIAAVYCIKSTQAQSLDDPWNENDWWRMNDVSAVTLNFNVDGQERTVNCRLSADKVLVNLAGIDYRIDANLVQDELTLFIDGHRRTLTVCEEESSLTLFDEFGTREVGIIKPDLGADVEDNFSSPFVAPMNGTIIDIMVDAGGTVKEGDAVIIMEAMKMQHTMHAPADGIIGELFCSVGELVNGGTTLADFKISESEDSDG